MFSHILVPVDGTAASMRTAHYAITLAKTLKAQITVLIATTPWEVYFAREVAVVVPEVVVTRVDYDWRTTQAARQTLRAVADAAKQDDVTCTTMLVQHRDPHQTIIDTAAERGCDLIVMSSSARGGLAGLLMGSQTRKVLAASPVPVLVYR